ncbi:hypothetical protein LCGC14_2638040, partial [marine sediment metagenome]
MRCGPSAHCDQNIDPERDGYVGSYPVDLHGRVAGRTVGWPGVQVAPCGCDRFLAEGSLDQVNRAASVEDAVAGRIQDIAADDEVLEFLVGETNKRMLRRKPSLERQRRALQRTLDEVRAEADAVLSGWASLEQRSGRDFLTEKLGELAEQRSELEHGLADISHALTQIEEERVTAEAVRASLLRFKDVYAHLKPFERKELLRLLLRRAEVGDRQIVLEIYPVTTSDMEMPQSRSRSEAP